MNKEEATKILAQELSNKLGRQIVSDSAYKEYLIRNSKCCYQIADPIAEHITPYSQKNSGNTTKIIDKILLRYPHLKYANYFFMEKIFTNKTTKGSDNIKFPALITTYALIGKKEESDLKYTYYKDVTSSVLCAMDSLNIKNFIKLYQTYINSDSNKIHLMNSQIQYFLKGVPKLKYDSDEETKISNLNSDITSLNFALENMGIQSRLDYTAYRKKHAAQEYPNFIHKQNVIDVFDEIKRNYDNYILNFDTFKEFLDFVFRIPYEDQNIKCNKEILKSKAKILHYQCILENEYVKGRHFKEYFECLNSEHQTEVVRCLKKVPKKNSANNSFLWSKGFKDVKLDYMDLYKDNARGFIDYFSSRGPEEKKIIIKDIMICDYTNKPVAEWLDDNELDLMREVSMDE